LNNHRWNILPPVPDTYLPGDSSFSRLIFQLLYNRGLTETAQQKLFIAGDERLSNDPFLLPDMHPAVARIYRALLSGEKVAVYGDFDADGITSTVLLVQGLALLDCEAIPYIPDRITEGHGLVKDALKELLRKGVSLVITVDCGTTNLPEVEYAKKLGIDVLITDHHTPLDELPAAVAVVNPKRTDSAYPFSELAGVGVAFKLIQALYQNIGKEEACLKPLIDLVTIGTVADMSPLLGENRYLVREGLKEMNKNLRLGIRALLEKSERSTENLDASSIGWVIAPRLNAAGRLAHAMESYNLLMTVAEAEAKEMAASLEETNAERQELTASITEKAREQVLAQGILPILIADDSEYNIGIAGLVASRLAEEFYRPAIVIETGEQQSSGSCRSIPEFNIVAALNHCGRLFTHFGGHKMEYRYRGKPARTQWQHLSTYPEDGAFRTK